MNLDIKGPFIKWLNFGYEGWKPYSYNSIKEALEAETYGNEFIITKVVNYEVSET